MKFIFYMYLLSMLFIFYNYILNFLLAFPNVYNGPFKLQPEDGFMKVETCCCYVLLISHILRNEVVLEYKIIYFY